MPIGIDTHGLDQPADEPELNDAETERLSEIEEQIGQLIDEFCNITTGWPSISGYRRVL